MAVDLLSYNNALTAYKKAPSITSYNNVLNVANQAQKGSNQSTGNVSGFSSGGSSNNGSSNGGSSSAPPYSPNTQNQTVDYNGVTWKGNPGQGWTAQGTTGGSGNGSTVDPAVQMQQDIANAYKTQNDAYTKGLSDYQKAHPFNFDDMLAQETQKAKGNISPYYDQILTNYMKGIEYLKGNTIEDENRALTKLQADYDAFTGQNKVLLDTTIRQVGQNYGNAGSYDSGARSRAQGEAEQTTQFSQQQAERQYQFDTQAQKIQANRVLNQEIPLQTTQEQEQTANQEAGDINTQAQQLAEYDKQKYNYLSQEAAVASVPAVGKYGTPNTIPGLSSAQTQQTLQGLLPNVQVSSFGGAQATPILGYG